jgi:precorrin-8X/cobalt-precorrin-8 methylmutase
LPDVFDRIVIVDWSASNTPKGGADSIWVGCLDHGGTAAAVNHRTRAAAFDALVELARAPGRVLLGFDFPLGYPAGFAAALGLPGTPWAATWAFLTEQIVDDARNRNNRFEVAADVNRRLGRRQFWAAPPRRAGEHLTTTKPPRTDAHLAEFRQAELRFHEVGKRPFSVWHLLGAGSVGSQALTGIPVVERLRRHPALHDRAQVWPFQTGLTLPTGPDAIVMAEIWPSMIRFKHVDHPVKDARQVIALAHWLADQPPTIFTPAAANSPSVLTEEGWVLGLT